MFSVGSVSDKDDDKTLEDTVDADRMVHDIATQDVLDVEFPTWYFSTHGLSRPSTPVEEDQQRSVIKSIASFTSSKVFIDIIVVVIAITLRRMDKLSRKVTF